MTQSAADWLARGNAHYDAQRWNEAGAALERALAVEPAHPRAWYRLGNVREEQGRDAEAVACFERAVALDPSHAKSWNNLGAARQRLGRIEAAAAAYRTALEKDPALVQPYLNLGRMSEGRGDLEAAARYYRAGLEHHPNDPMLEHLLAAASGANTARAPAGYVASLYDEMAARFDSHLQRDLDYRVPDELAKLLGKVSGRVLDLGCGTGLAGAALAAADVELVGVDLSRRMLELAAKRGIYRRLVHAEVHEALEREAAASYRAVIATDAFIYIGELAAIFAGVARVLVAGGVFAFSVEGLESGDYRLQPTGRYAHSLEYLYRLARLAGCAQRTTLQVNIRREKQGFADGWLVLLERL